MAGRGSLPHFQVRHGAKRGWLALAGASLLLAAAASCGGTASESLGGKDASGGSGAAPGSGGKASSGGGSSGSCPDADGDGLSDAVEGRGEEWMVDSDYDGVEDYLDTDSDNDGISDEVEAGAHEPCGPGRDTDLDGAPDYRDDDSDGDEVPDKLEIARGLSPLLVNSTGGVCDDFEIYWFEECDPQNVIVYNQCYGDDTYATTILRAAWTITGNPSDLSFTVVPLAEEAPQVSVTALSVLPEGAGSVENGVPTLLDGGAHVTVSLTVSTAWQGTRPLLVQLQSASQGLVAEAKLLVVTSLCPLIK